MRPLHSYLGWASQIDLGLGGGRTTREGPKKVIATTAENGYPAKVFSLSCPTNPKTGMGEMTFIKTIEGKDKFYVVQKAWRTKKYKQDQIPLTSDDVSNWTGYLRSVHVCDNRIKGRSCP